MQFGVLTGFQNSLNLGVSGANLLDIKYVYNLAKENNITYDTIIFDFNPWLTIEGSDSRNKQFSKFHILKYAFLDILKFNYNIEDLITIFGTFNNYVNSFHETNSEEIKQHSYFIKNTDGSIQHKSITPKERINAIQGFTNDLYQMNAFNNINYELLNQTVSLYNEASKDGICIVTLTPFHMDLYKNNKNDVRIKNIRIVEDALKNSNHDFQIYGSFDPYKLNINESDFYDGFHLKEKALYKIFQQKYTSPN
jgi:hypothetical protein